MTKNTHLCAGIATGIICNVSAPCLVLIGVGSLLPDIDMKGSTLGKKAPFLSIFFEHRGFTHSLLFFGITFLLNPYLGLGVLTHIILDLINPKGVQLFCPIKEKVAIPLIKTSSLGEKIFFAICIIITAIFLIYQISLMSSDKNIYMDFLSILPDAKENILNILSFFSNLFSSPSTN